VWLFSIGNDQLIRVTICLTADAADATHGHCILGSAGSLLYQFPAFRIIGCSWPGHERPYLLRSGEAHQRDGPSAQRGPVVPRMTWCNSLSAPLIED
jgi:hypothetical protein